MDFDVAIHLGTVERSVSSPEHDSQPARAVTLSRSFPTTVEDLWDAVTNEKRLPLWFLPVAGELQLGGRYQLEGNAGGLITACEPPARLAITWEFGDDTSWVEVRISDDGPRRARLTLTHTAELSPHWDHYGPGATGVGWELGLMGLALHITQPAESQLDEAAFAASPDGNAFIKASSDGWGQAAVASGTEPDAAHAAARRTTAFYTGESA